MPSGLRYAGVTLNRHMDDSTLDPSAWQALGKVSGRVAGERAK
jgi:hypothetical protein